MNNQDLEKLYYQFLTLKNNIEEYIWVKCLIQYSIITKDWKIAAWRVNSIDLHQIELDEMKNKINNLK